MTELLEKALAKVSQLSPEEQDAIAAMILEELEDEQRWDAAFAASQRELAKLAEQVRSDIRTDRVRKMGFDEVIASFFSRSKIFRLSPVARGTFCSKKRA